MKTYNDRNIKDVLGEFVNGHKRIQRGVTNVTLRQVWDEQMGPVIGRYTSDIKLYEGTVTIQLTSAPLRQELSMSTDKIIARLNEGMGAGTVRQVILR